MNPNNKQEKYECTHQRIVIAPLERVRYYVVKMGQIHHVENNRETRV